MSRAPREREAPLWTPLGRDHPSGVVLVTARPHEEDSGIPAVWYQRRKRDRGRWVPYADWCHSLTLTPLDPQPTHFRPDPDRGKLTV